MRVWARGRLETADNKLRIAAMDGSASVGGEVLVKNQKPNRVENEDPSEYSSADLGSIGAWDVRGYIWIRERCIGEQ